MSENLVEICDSLGNLDLCVLHLKRTMGIVNIGLMRMKLLAFSNDIIHTATPAHGIDNVLYDIPRATTMNTSYNYMDDVNVGTWIFQQN